MTELESEAVYKGQDIGELLDLWDQPLSHPQRAQLFLHLEARGYRVSALPEPPAPDAAGMEVEPRWTTDEIEQSESYHRPSGSPLVRAFSFRGRRARGSYYLGNLFSLVALALASVGVGFLQEVTGWQLMGFATVLLLAIYSWSTIASSVQRMHDLGRPDSHAWLLLIPLYNLLLAIQLTFERGTRGANPYGPDPLANPQRTT